MKRSNVSLIRFRKKSYEVIGEQRNSGLPLAKGRQLNPKDIEPVIEILAKTTHPDRLLDVFICGGDQPTLTLISFSPRTRRTVLVSKTRSRLTCVFSSIVVISSRKMVPL